MCHGFVASSGGGPDARRSDPWDVLPRFPVAASVRPVSYATSRRRLKDVWANQPQAATTADAAKAPR